MGKKRKMISKPQKFGRKFASHPAKTKNVPEEALKQEVMPEPKKQKVEEMSNKRNWLKEQAALKAKQEEEAAAKAEEAKKAKAAKPKPVPKPESEPTPKPEPKKVVVEEKKEIKPKAPRSTPRRKKTKPSDD